MLPSRRKVLQLLEPMNLITYILSIIGLYHIRYDISGHTLAKIITYFISMLRILFAVIGVCMYSTGAVSARISFNTYQAVRIFFSAYCIRDFFVVCLFFYIFEKRGGRGFDEFIATWKKVKLSKSNDKYTYIAIGCFLALNLLAVSICVSSLLLIFFSDSQLSIIKLYFGHITDNDFNVLKLYYVTSTFLLFLSDGVSLTLLCSVCALLYREFALFHKKLENDVKSWKLNGNSNTDAQTTNETMETNVVTESLDNKEVNNREHVETISNQREISDALSNQNQQRIDSVDELDQVSVFFFTFFFSFLFYLCILPFI